MKEEIEKLIEKYRTKISKLQHEQGVCEASGRCGVAIVAQGEIQAYNAIISDLRKLIYPS